MKSAQPDPVVGGPLTLVVAAPMLYHPACGNGGGVLAFEWLARLSSRAQVHLVAFGTGTPADESAVAALRAFTSSLTVLPLPTPAVSGLGSALLQVLSGVPREARDHRSAAMSQCLATLSASVRADAVILQFPHMAQYVDAMPGVPVLIDVQDLHAVSRFREWQQADGTRWWRRAWRLHSCWAWTRYEWRHYGRAQRLMALSEADRGVLAAFLPQVPAFLSPVAWDPASQPPEAQGQRVLFMGNFAHAPNADGLQWLLTSVWPEVRQRCPTAELQVVGRGVPSGWAAAAPAGVVFHGHVPDVGVLLRTSAVSVVPYRFGGGIKIKAIEAMAAGCPVVATSVGSEGLSVSDGVHLRVADGPIAFADALVELLQQPALRHQMAARALALVAERFSWARKIDDCCLALTAMVVEARGRAAASLS